MAEADPFERVTVISVYTRAQAIEDGVLVDVTETARKAGFKHHTVVTRNVWERCVAVPEGLEGQGQDEQGRLWDVIWMASLAARKAATRESLVTFTVSVLKGSQGGLPMRRDHELWLHIGPGDAAEPVLTVMFPEDY